jgi:hypothetical protein
MEVKNKIYSLVPSQIKLWKFIPSKIFNNNNSGSITNKNRIILLSF